MTLSRRRKTALHRSKEDTAHAESRYWSRNPSGSLDQAGWFKWLEGDWPGLTHLK